MFQRSAKIKAQLESVLTELDRDTILEIATGVAQVNFNVERLVQNLVPKSTSFGNL